MTPLIFDIIILSLLLLSLALGFMRGFVNEVFTIVGWIGAVIATIYFTPVLNPIAESFIAKKWLAKIAVSAGIFLVTLGVISAVSHFATKSLEKSKLNIVDRSLGFAFGALRAVVLFGLGFLLFAYVFEPDKRPDFIQKSRSLPFLEASASWVQTVIPGLDEKIKITAESTTFADTPKEKEVKDKDVTPSVPEKKDEAK